LLELNQKLLAKNEKIESLMEKIKNLKNQGQNLPPPSPAVSFSHPLPLTYL